MQLYRGDNFYNKHTECGKYRTEGIRSKTFGSGDPAYIQREGLINAIQKHVKPDRLDADDMKYYNTTDFISFSESRNRALYWLSDMDKLILTPCMAPYTETRYLFTININMAKAKFLGDGIYHYEYYCNPGLKEPNASDLMSQIEVQLMQQSGCDICVNGKYHHQLILINSEKYLISQNNDHKFDEAIQFARNDQEWLILPFDHMSYNFKHARIPRSEIWKVELFNAREYRDPQYYASLGIIKSD